MALSLLLWGRGDGHPMGWTWIPVTKPTPKTPSHLCVVAENWGVRRRTFYRVPRPELELLRKRFLPQRVCIFASIVERGDGSDGFEIGHVYSLNSHVTPPLASIVGLPSIPALPCHWSNSFRISRLGHLDFLIDLESRCFVAARLCLPAWAWSSASFFGLHQEQVIPRLSQSFEPPHSSAVMCSTIQSSEGPSFRPHSRQHP